MNSQTGLSISEVEHIRQSVRDILVTPIGSRVMRREYGSLLSALIDQPQTRALRLQIMAACYSAIQKWEPRVSLTSITFERSENDGGLYVDITGTRSANGQPIPQLTIERGDGDRHQFAIADREAYTGVTAKWLHTKDPKPQKQKVKLKRKPKVQHLRALQHPKATKTTAKVKAKKEQEAREGEYMAGESDNVLELTTIYATKAQAKRAAQAKWDKLQRGVAEFSISLAIGRADLFPETPVAEKGFKRVIDEQAWIISRVVHNLNGNGYTTGLELEVKVSDVEYESEEITQ
ncbi:TPA: GPW/gp25 family protein [Enterobacter bugandensis]|nr:GPW/gp25 family protein [Enterobacter bugandensis]